MTVSGREEQNRKRSFLRSYAPILFVAVCAVIVGAFMLSGRLDIRAIPDLVQGRYLPALLILLALFALKGMSGVILYDVLILVVAVIFPTVQALLINAVGTFVSLTISYAVGAYTKIERIEQRLSRHEKIKKYFERTQECGFVFCFAVHSLGLSMEVLGIIFGMMRFPFAEYLISSWLGIIPGMIWITVAGSTWNVTSPLFIAMLLFSLACLAFGILYTRRKLKGSGEE